MVSFDVKSVFTSIPVDLALSITKERLQRDQNLAERTNLSVYNILRLSDSVQVLNHNYFKYDGDHYKQIFGCAMGSPISPVLADLVMEGIEEQRSPHSRSPPIGGFAMLMIVMLVLRYHGRWILTKNGKKIFLLFKLRRLR